MFAEYRIIHPDTRPLGKYILQTFIHLTQRRVAYFFPCQHLQHSFMINNNIIFFLRQWQRTEKKPHTITNQANVDLKNAETMMNAPIESNCRIQILIIYPSK